MDPFASAIQSGPPRSLLPPPAQRATLLTWPMSAQLALGLIVVAGLFFLLGRWSSETTKAPIDIHEHAGPALDLNRATKPELRLLPGLGDGLAQRIIDFRTRHGSFRQVEDLRQVAGIGPKTLERIRPFLFVATPEVFVSLDGDEPSNVESKSTFSQTAAARSKAAKIADPINVNQATQDELQKLPGIGPKLSQRILDERAKAAFQSIDELRRVPGIGPKTLAKIRPFVTLN